MESSTVRSCLLDMAWLLHHELIASVALCTKLCQSVFCHGWDETHKPPPQTIQTVQGCWEREESVLDAVAMKSWFSK